MFQQQSADHQSQINPQQTFQHHSTGRIISSHYATHTTKLDP